MSDEYIFLREVHKNVAKAYNYLYIKIVSRTLHASHSNTFIIQKYFLSNLIA